MVQPAYKYASLSPTTQDYPSKIIRQSKVIASGTMHFQTLPQEVVAKILDIVRLIEPHKVDFLNQRLVCRRFTLSPLLQGHRLTWNRTI